jgi:hypothetical protein
MACIAIIQPAQSPEINRQDTPDLPIEGLSGPEPWTILHISPLLPFPAMGIRIAR